MRVELENLSHPRFTLTDRNIRIFIYNQLLSHLFYKSKYLFTVSCSVIIKVYRIQKINVLLSPFRKLTSSWRVKYKIQNSDHKILKCSVFVAKTPKSP